MIVGRAEREYVQRPGRLVADPFDGVDTDPFSVRVVQLDGDNRRNPHLHPHSQEVIFVVRGTGTLWENGERHPVAEGDCVLIPTGVPHATVPNPGTTMELVCFFAHPDLPGNTEEITDVVVNDDGGGDVSR